MFGMVFNKGPVIIDPLQFSLQSISTLFQQYSSVLMSLDVCGSEMYSKYYDNSRARHHCVNEDEKVLLFLPYRYRELMHEL